MFSISELNSLSTTEQFKYILDNMNEITNNKDIDTSKIKNKEIFNVIKNMSEKGQSITNCCCATGNLDFLRYLNDEGIKVNQKLSFYWSAINGRLDCLKFLDSLGNEEVKENQFNTDIIEAAAMSGYIECVKFLVENNYPFDEDAAVLAERQGQYECAKYLRENENNDNIDIYDMAIKEGIFEDQEDIQNQINAIKNQFSNMFG